MIEKQVIEQILAPELSQRDFFLVEVKVSASNAISVVIDSMSGVTIDDCVAISKAIESQLDREVEDFELQVASAGLSEPFKVFKQYQKFLNQEVSVVLKGGGKEKGILSGVTEEEIQLNVIKLEKVDGKKKKQEVESVLKIKFSEINTTKLIISFK